MNGFCYFNPNEKGDYKHDCVIRAYSFFFGTTWKKAFLDTMQFCADRGLVRFNYASVFNLYLEHKGYKRHRSPKKGMTVAQFRDEYAEMGKCYIISCSHHFSIIWKKDIIDIGDCSDYTLKAYWER